MKRDVYEQREHAVAEKLAQRWNCEWGSMGRWNPIDVFFMRKRTMCAFAEIRTRNALFSDQRLVLIDHDKWLHMTTCENTLYVPTLYVVAYRDSIVSARVSDLKVTGHDITYRGRSDRTHKPNDQCPVVQVSADQFKVACNSDGIFEADVPPVKRASLSSNAFHAFDWM